MVQLNKQGVWGENLFWGGLKFALLLHWKSTATPAVLPNLSRTVRTPRRAKDNISSANAHIQHVGLL